MAQPDCLWTSYCGLSGDLELLVLEVNKFPLWGLAVAPRVLDDGCANVLLEVILKTVESKHLQNRTKHLWQKYCNTKGICDRIYFLDCQQLEQRFHTSSTMQKFLKKTNHMKKQTFLFLTQLMKVFTFIWLYLLNHNILRLHVTLMCIFCYITCYVARMQICKNSKQGYVVH